MEANVSASSEAQMTWANLENEQHKLEGIPKTGHLKILGPPSQHTEKELHKCCTNTLKSPQVRI